jgi:hypothetical protein
MVTVKQTSKNNKEVKLLQSVKQENPAEVQAEPAKEKEAKESVSSFLEAHKPEPHKSAESRIEAMKQFEALSTRYNQLKDKSNELKTFQAGNDKLSAKVVFKNAQGFEFTVQNSNVIGKLIEAGEKELSILLNEAENEVLTFDI